MIQLIQLNDLHIEEGLYSQICEGNISCELRIAFILQLLWIQMFGMYMRITRNLRSGPE